MLRISNINLRRNVCNHFKYEKSCKGKNRDCNNCSVEKMDKVISAQELGEMFGVSGDVIYNWEAGQPVPVEDLLFYCKIAQVELKDIIIFKP